MSSILPARLGLLFVSLVPVLGACATAGLNTVERSKRAVVVIEVFEDVAQRERAGHGSGFFVSRDGDVITNLHVVDGARSARVVTADSSTFTVTAVVAEPADQTDAIRLATATYGREVDVLPLADRLPSVNEPVRVIGAPLGLTQTVTGGIVSAIRDNDPHWGHVIQIDAATTHGSSGGPIIDSEGRVIGITAGGAVGSSGPVQGLNFAIPASRLAALTPRTRTTLASWTDTRERERAARASLIYRRGLTFYEARSYGPALVEFARAIELNPRLENAWIKLGSSAIRLKRYATATRVYEHLVSLRPDASPLHNNLGVALQGLGRYHEAVEHYLRALELDATNRVAFTNLGHTYVKLRRYPDAINAYREALRLDPGHAATHYYLGLAHLGNREFTAAWSEYWMIRPLNPELARALLQQIRKYA